MGFNAGRLGRAGWLAAAALALAFVAAAPGASACAGPCAAADYDGDGVNDFADNCPLWGNLSQSDNDKDTPAPVVDVGKPDGVPNTPVLSFDSPVRVYPATPYQTGQPAPSDIPPDKGGDACDEDDDNDGVKDRATGGKPPDNCPLVANPDQRDTDGDGIGDACDGATSAPSAAAAARIRASAPRSLRFDAIALGIVVPVRCSARCQVAGELVLDRRSSRRVRLAAPLVLGRGSAFLEGAGTTYLFVSVPPASVRRLARAFVTLRPLLRITAQGATVTERRVALRRR